MREMLYKMIGDRYLITNCGQIIDIKTGRELKHTLDKTGYLRVTLHYKSYLVHRLVAKYFCENKYNKPWVDHKNRNKTDNRASNLHWVTPQENNLNRDDTLPIGMRKVDLTPEEYGRQQANRWRKSNPEKVKEIKRNWYIKNKNNPNFKAKRAENQRNYRKRLRGTSY
jgi:hypothetical protein